MTDYYTLNNKTRSDSLAYTSKVLCIITKKSFEVKRYKFPLKSGNCEKRMPAKLIAKDSIQTFLLLHCDLFARSIDWMLVAENRNSHPECNQTPCDTATKEFTPREKSLTLTSNGKLFIVSEELKMKKWSIKSSFRWTDTFSASNWTCSRTEVSV